MPTVTKEAFLAAMHVLSTAVVEALYPTETAPEEPAPEVPEAPEVPAPEVPSATVIAVDTSGTVDVTDAMQVYLDQAGELHIPAGRYLIDAEKSLSLRSNTKLTLAPDAVLIAKPNGNHQYKVLMIHSVADVTISGGRLVGDRDAHTYTPFPDWPNGTPNSRGTHEWGHGIGVYGCQRVTLQDMHLSDFTGDGIAVGGGKDDAGVFVRSSDTLIQRVVSTNNRRQGLSITNAVGTKVLDSEFSHTNGTSPQCGIDIEPNNDPGETENGRCRDVLIERCVLKNNAVYGLNIFLRIDDVTVKDCQFLDNISCGAVAVQVNNVKFLDNKFTANGSTGLFIKKGVAGCEVTGNAFALNYTKQDPTARAEPIVAAGIVQYTRRDLLVDNDATGVNVGVNSYM